MKKVGTISSSFGLIFLGLWLIIKENNQHLALSLLNWWPILLVILGMEIILYFSKNKDVQRVNINLLIVPVIIIFIFTSVYYSYKPKINLGFNWTFNDKNLDNVVDIFSNINEDNFKVIKIKKVVDSNVSMLVFNSKNSDITIKNSDDDKIDLEGTVYTKKSYDKDQYDVKIEKNLDNVNLDITDSYVEKIKVTLSIPKQMNIKLKGDNVRLLSDKELVKADLEVNNLDADVSNVTNLNMQMNNGKVTIKNCRSNEIKSNNGMFNIDGDCENLDLKMNNGIVNINDKICKNVNIEMNSGTVKCTSDESDENVKLELDRGTCTLNKDTRINSGIEKSIADAKGNVKIKVSNGLIVFND